MSFFKDTATTEIYTLSLHDALPISCATRWARTYAVTLSGDQVVLREPVHVGELVIFQASVNRTGRTSIDRKSTRLNSSHANISYAVFCLKKKFTRKTIECTSTIEFC